MLTNELLKLMIAVGSEWVMILLIVLSILSLAIIAERFWFFYTKKDSLLRLDSLLAQAFEKKGDDNIRTIIEKDGSPLLRSAIGSKDESFALVKSEASERIVASVLSRERVHIEKRLGFLGTLGSNAPFIGLFGTVLGIIRAFHDLSLDSKGGASTVMAGISEALVATAIGLFVAIPAVMAFNYFQREADKLVTVEESLAQTILAERLRAAEVDSSKKSHDSSEEKGQ